MVKYNQSVARLCSRIDKRKEEYVTLKASGHFKLEKDGDTIKLYHYGTSLGGVRFGDKKRIILGYPITMSDKVALNTVWKYYQMGRRVHLSNDNVYHIEIVNECSDNTRLDV